MYAVAQSDLIFDDLEVDPESHRKLNRKELWNDSSDFYNFFFVLLILMRTTCGPNMDRIFKVIQGQIHCHRIFITATVPPPAALMLALLAGDCISSKETNQLVEKL